MVPITEEEIRRAAMELDKEEMESLPLDESAQLCMGDAVLASMNCSDGLSPEKLLSGRVATLLMGYKIAEMRGAHVCTCERGLKQES